jgi:hypothetical protein
MGSITTSRNIKYGFDTIAMRAWRRISVQCKDGRWSTSFYLENGMRKTVYGKTRKDAYWPNKGV